MNYDYIDKLIKEEKGEAAKRSHWRDHVLRTLKKAKDMKKKLIEKKTYKI